MKTKLCLLLSAFLAVTLFVSATQATTITFNGLGLGEWRSGNWAGELEITPTGLPGLPDGVSLDTFCVETLETINPGSTYNAVLNTVAIHGSESINDPLDPETAWLFNQYWTGAIDINTNTKAADFQIAIWILEDEALGTTLLTPAAQAYVDLANASGWTDIDGIRVLNMGDAPEFVIQDLLIPEPATIALLGLGALSLLRRKR